MDPPAPALAQQSQPSTTVMGVFGGKIGKTLSMEVHPPYPLTLPQPTTPPDTTTPNQSPPPSPNQPTNHLMSISNHCDLPLLASNCSSNDHIQPLRIHLITTSNHCGFIHDRSVERRRRSFHGDRGSRLTHGPGQKTIIQTTIQRTK